MNGSYLFCDIKVIDELCYILINQNNIFMHKYNAIVKVNYEGMKGKTYPVHEIVSTRVTIKKNNKLIDFNINEVKLKLTKEAQFTRNLILNKIIK
jgi:hypothetical protein